MKNYHKINPFWTYSRGERIGIAILTFGLLINSYIRWQNAKFISQQLKEIKNHKHQAPTYYMDTIPTQTDDTIDPLVNHSSNTSFSTKEVYPKKVNLAKAALQDLLTIGLDSTISIQLLKNKLEYKNWQSICNNNEICAAKLQAKQIYYWQDYESITVNLNTADTSQLKQLKGIGSKLSNRIIKYRNKLGGFHSIEQLQEVWGLQTHTFHDIKPKVIILKAPSKKILSKHIQDFINHPYMPFEIRDKMKNYLEQNPNDSLSLNQIICPFFPDSLKLKFTPYFE